MVIYRADQDANYAYLDVVDADSFESAMKGIDARHGYPLRDRWNPNWQFFVDRWNKRKPIGDFADMNKLWVREPGRKFLEHLVPPEDREVLTGFLEGEPIWLFNFIRRVARDQMDEQPPSAIFRVEPVGLDILCGPDFVKAVQASNLRGLEFRPIDMNDRVPFI